MKSNATVTAPDSSTDPTQPNRFEKKKNTILPAFHPGTQHDLDHPVLLVPELLVHCRSIFELGGVCGAEARIYTAGLDSLQKRLSVGLDMRLPGLDRQTLVHSH